MIHLCNMLKQCIMLIQGCVRNGGRSGAAEGPSVFRRFLNRTGTLDNREFNVDLSDLIVFDRGDVERQSMENALHALKSRTYAALAQVNLLLKMEVIFYYCHFIYIFF